MFSREDVAARVNQDFEPAWEMVRPVPIVRIDFGNGHVASRTLHGNVATYVCVADGLVVDILPGMYTPDVFTAALQHPRNVALDLRARPDASTVSTRLQQYHREKAAAQRNQDAQAAVLRALTAQAGQPNGPATRELDRGKGAVEWRLERVVRPPQPGANYGIPPRLRAGANVNNWTPLVEDTLRNEAQRRLQIHDRLAASNPVRPEQIKKWLYKEVLHADLMDPYLGLGDTLFGDDIFPDLEGGWSGLR